jgi:hypothetical protein
MCKEMPVIPVNKVVDPKRIIGKKWRAKEKEERHKGSLTKKNFNFMHSQTSKRYSQIRHFVMTLFQGQALFSFMRYIPVRRFT